MLNFCFSSKKEPGYAGLMLYEHLSFILTFYYKCLSTFSAFRVVGYSVARNCYIKIIQKMNMEFVDKNSAIVKKSQISNPPPLTK